MRRKRSTRDEWRQAARGQNHPDMTGVATIVVETDGSLRKIFAILDEVDHDMLSLNLT